MIKLSKYEIKNIIIEALIDAELYPFLKREFRYYGDCREDYYDIVDKISTETVDRHFGSKEA